MSKHTSFSYSLPNITPSSIPYGVSHRQLIDSLSLKYISPGW